MVRIGVYRGFEKDRSTNLTLLNFDVLNDFEETENYLKSFQLVGRFNEWDERLMEDRIYYVNIIPGEVNKPIEKFEILDKAKFVIHDKSEGLKITYKRFAGKHLIDTFIEEDNKAIDKYRNDLEEAIASLSEERASVKREIKKFKGKKKGTKIDGLDVDTLKKELEVIQTKLDVDKDKLKNIAKTEIHRKDNALQNFIDFCVNEEEGKRLHFNTFTKFFLTTVFEHYGYDNVIDLDEEELNNWKQHITEKVKSFAKSQDVKFSTWGHDEIEKLKANINKSPVVLAKMFNRTEASIATMKWKIRHNKIDGMDNTDKTENMVRNANDIAKALKVFRKEKGYSQKEMCKASGISISMLSQLERATYLGTNTPTVDKLLDYMEKNSSTFKKSKIALEKPKDEVKKDEPKEVINTETPTPMKKVSQKQPETVVEGLSEEDNLYAMQLVAEFKFMSAELLRMHAKLNELLSTKNNNNKTVTLKLSKSLKKLETA
jgi:transcriptional regulator with XRE-family HTH domain